MDEGKLRFIGVVEEVGEEKARLRIFREFSKGLKGIEEFSHLIILYWIHLRDTEKDRRTLLVFPRRHKVNVEKGVFACRSPSRPNPIGLCVVELVGVDDNVLTVKGLDAFKDSPIIDIKPYIPSIDAFPEARVPQWLKQENNSEKDQNISDDIGISQKNYVMTRNIG
ncbi:tRNA (N6-threonylcarbamoyladenosine(37)-N6)-methyltransferase TrmO [Candidatus Bathyarchaeota archaeon]|nr:tRNA (N6-threonylcarbamoyladenosine(37)-N6)-methyltransferase TrmO [Candidatus Bathyarchaeota archaeon]